MNTAPGPERYVRGQKRIDRGREVVYNLPTVNIRTGLHEISENLGMVLRKYRQEGTIILPPASVKLFFQSPFHQ